MGIQERDKLGKGSRPAYKKGMGLPGQARGKCEQHFFSVPLACPHTRPRRWLQVPPGRYLLGLYLPLAPSVYEAWRPGTHRLSKHERRANRFLFRQGSFNAAISRPADSGSADLTRDRGMPACWSLLVPVPQQRSSRHAPAPGSVLCPGVGVACVCLARLCLPSFSFGVVAMM